MEEWKTIINTAMKECRLCPRNCGADRLNGSLGVCRVSAKLKVARAALHYWEEPCLSGESGSGAVFFSGCSLGCVFCQNHSISRGKSGKEITIERLADIFLELQEKGANNINLVTGVQYIPQLIIALKTAKQHGLNLPIVYNSSGYEKVESLRLLEGLVDIYLPDFKYMSVELSKEYSKADDYPKAAQAAIAEMVRQQNKPVFDNAGMMKKGVIVRHLLLPTHSEDSKQIIKYLYETYGDKIYLSIMNQYTPVKSIPKESVLSRTVTADEYDAVIDYAVDIGVENGFIQEGGTAEESFIPEFDNEGV